MGNTSLVSSSGSGGTSQTNQRQQKGKKVVNAKLQTAEKTGVLNLADQVSHI